MYLEIGNKLFLRRNAETRAGLFMNAKEWQVESRKVQEIWFLQSPSLVLGPIRSPIQWIPQTLSSEVKQPGHEADLLPSYSAEAKKVLRYDLSNTYGFMADKRTTFSKLKLTCQILYVVQTHLPTKRFGISSYMF